MSEDELLAKVLAECKRLKVLAHHCPNSTRCQGDKGMPDLILAGQHGLILAELKSETGDTSADQDLWHWNLDQGKGGGQGCPYRLWRPSDLPEIMHQLAALA